MIGQEIKGESTLKKAHKLTQISTICLNTNSEANAKCHSFFTNLFEMNNKQKKEKAVNQEPGLSKMT